MTYVFRELTVSGGNFDVEGTSACMNEIVDTMVLAGWSIEQDLRSQAGSSTLANTHKITMVNNNGESGTDPNIFVTMVSGTTTTVGSDTLGFQLGLAYDTPSKLVPASGLPTPNQTTSSFADIVNCDSNGYTNLWIGCDKDSLVVFSNKTATSDNVLMIGRANTFLDGALEPYGTYICSQASHSVAQTSVLGHFGNNPVHNVLLTNRASFISTVPSAGTEPRTGLGQDKHLFTGLPLRFDLIDSIAGKKGIIGYVPNVYSMVSNLAGIPRIGKMVVSGTGQEFRVFAGAAVSLLRVT